MIKTIFFSKNLFCALLILFFFRQVEKLESNNLESKENLSEESKSSSTNSLDKIGSTCTTPTSLSSPTSATCTTDGGVSFVVITSHSLLALNCRRLPVFVTINQKLALPPCPLSPPPQWMRYQSITLEVKFELLEVLTLHRS